MKIKSILKGFTLIELLVVITIIGILATGATAVYTSQIQKARDSTRVTDVNALKSAIEQVYQDDSQYPHSNLFATWALNVRTYMEKIPSDPKSDEACNNGTPCDYLYITQDDNNWILFWEYELSTWFENTWNVNSRAWWDSWNDSDRFEVWIETNINDTSHSGAIATGWCLDVGWAAPGQNDLIKVSTDWC